jgi:hypothetical protein
MTAITTHHLLASMDGEKFPQPLILLSCPGTLCSGGAATVAVLANLLTHETAGKVGKVLKVNISSAGLRHIGT